MSQTARMEAYSTIQAGINPSAWISETLSRIFSVEYKQILQTVSENFQSEIVQAVSAISGTNEKCIEEELHRARLSLENRRLGAGREAGE